MNTKTRPATPDLAEKMTAAFESFDREAIRECCTPDMVRWNNLTEVDEPLEELLATLKLEARHLLDSKFTDVRRMPMEGGFVQLQTVRGRTAKGTSLRMPVCLVVTLRDGLIARIDEYVNVAHVQPLIDEMFGPSGTGPSP